MAKIPPIEVDPKTGWSDWQSTGFKFRTMCCECSLTHDDEYRIVEGKLLWRTRVNKIATANARRKKKK
jgi:hypothetical protein